MYILYMYIKKHVYICIHISALICIVYVPMFAKNRQYLVQTVRAQAVDRDQKRKLTRWEDQHSGMIG